MAVKRVNHFVIAEIFRGAVRVNHQVNAVINPQIGFCIDGKKPVVTVQRIGAPDFNRAVIGGGHALHNGRGDVAAQGADGVGALRRGLWCGACQQCGHQCGGGGDLLCKCHVLCSFAFQVCPGGLPGLWGGAALFERCDPARASA